MNYANTIHDDLPVMRSRLCVAVRGAAGAFSRDRAINQFNYRLYLPRDNFSTAVRNYRPGSRGYRFFGAGVVAGGRVAGQSRLATVGLRCANHHDAGPFGQALRGANRSSWILGDDAGAVHAATGVVVDRNRGSRRKVAAGWSLSQLAAKLGALLSFRQAFRKVQP